MQLRDRAVPLVDVPPAGDLRRAQWQRTALVAREACSGLGCGATPGHGPSAHGAEARGVDLQRAVHRVVRVTVRERNEDAVAVRCHRAGPASEAAGPAAHLADGGSVDPDSVSFSILEIGDLADELLSGLAHAPPP